MNNPSFPFHTPPGAHYSRRPPKTNTINKHEPISPALWALVIGSDGQMHPVTSTSDCVLDESMTQIGSIPIYMASPSATTSNNANNNNINIISMPFGRLLWPGTRETKNLTAAAGRTAPPLSVPNSPTRRLSLPRHNNPLPPLLRPAEVSPTGGAVASLLQKPRVTPNNWATSNSIMAHPLVMAAAALFRPQHVLSQMTHAGLNTAPPMATFTTSSSSSRPVEAKAAAASAIATQTASVGSAMATHTTNQMAAAATATATSIAPFPVLSQSTIWTTTATPPTPSTESPMYEPLKRRRCNNLVVESPQTHPQRTDKEIYDYDSEGNYLNDEQQQEGEEKVETQEPSPNVRRRKRKDSFNEEEHDSSDAEHDDGNNTIQDDGNNTDKNNDTTAATKLQHPLFQHRISNTRADMWGYRFYDLLAYKKEHGHCHVPFAYQDNPALARWVKRQRFHYKLYHGGKPSPMTPERLQALLDIGFVWDSQETSWNEKYAELVTFRNEHGHCNVPTLYGPNPSLAIWVKYQRKQYRYWQQGAPSALTPQRICDLENIGFAWLLRSYHRTSDKPKKRRLQQLSTGRGATCTTDALSSSSSAPSLSSALSSSSSSSRTTTNK